VGRYDQRNHHRVGTYDKKIVTVGELVGFTEMVKRNERVCHIPTKKYGTVRCVARDGTWAEVCFDGVKHGRRVPQAELRSVRRILTNLPRRQEGQPGQLIVEIDRASFYDKDHLCDTCCRATAVDCPYLGGEKIEEDIAKTGCHTVMARLPDGSVTYKVQKCKRYEKGKLPPIRWPEEVMKEIMERR